MPPTLRTNPPKPMPQELTEVLDLMTEIGGSFVKSLAQTYRLADPTNREILYQNFTGYFQDYSGKLEQMKAAKQ